MATTTVHNLATDDDLIKCVWLRDQGEVFARLDHMMRSGWERTTRGLESVNEFGLRVIARPVKIKGNDMYTGIVVWRVTDDDEM